jgi:hypothetical protein
MRENRPYGSEGGAARKGRLYPYPGVRAILGSPKITAVVIRNAGNTSHLLGPFDRRPYRCVDVLLAVRLGPLMERLACRRLRVYCRIRSTRCSAAELPKGRGTLA